MADEPEEPGLEKALCAHEIVLIYEVVRGLGFRV